MGILERKSLQDSVLISCYSPTKNLWSLWRHHCLPWHASNVHWRTLKDCTLVDTVLCVIVQLYILLFCIYFIIIFIFMLYNRYLNPKISQNLTMCKMTNGLPPKRVFTALVQWGYFKLGGWLCPVNIYTIGHTIVGDLKFHVMPRFALQFDCKFRYYDSSIVINCHQNQPSTAIRNIA